MAMTAEEKAGWLAARAGKHTASRQAAVMDFRKDGKPSAERTKYMMECLAERLTGQSAPHFVSEPMMWGLEYEDEAVDVYVALTGRTVRRSKFYEHPTIENFGATPDRDVDGGHIEVKCPTTATFLRWVMDGVVPEEHKPQMAAQLACSGQKRSTFIAYDPRIREEGKRLFVREYIPTPEYLAEVEAAAVKFLDELDAMFSAFVEAA